MKLYTSTAPLPKNVKEALSSEQGRMSFLEFLNSRLGADHQRSAEEPPQVPESGKVSIPRVG